MPIHDWTRVDPGLFHDFHQVWTIELRNALNHGVLPPGYFALAEQVVSGPVPDVVTLESREEDPDPSRSGGGVAVSEAPPRARFVSTVETDPYARKANRIVIRHRHGRVVAVIEVVSPGNKSSSHALRTFAKAVELLSEGIHLLVIDLLPPSVRDPEGIHKANWEELSDEPFVLPADKSLTVAAYRAGAVNTAYVEPVAVGDRLPELPLFLDVETYVPAPLEATCQTAWTHCPDIVRDLLEQGNGTDQT